MHCILIFLPALNPIPAEKISDHLDKQRMFNLRIEYFYYYYYYTAKINKEK